jgi:hypothetical protein
VILLPAGIDGASGWPKPAKPTEVFKVIPRDNEITRPNVILPVQRMYLHNELQA